MQIYTTLQETGQNLHENMEGIAELVTFSLAH